MKKNISRPRSRISISAVLTAALLVAFFAMFGSVKADERVDAVARDLLSKAGPAPEAIIDPPMPDTGDIGLVERLKRLWMEKILGFRIIHSSARGKACLANQRVIAGTVEMYNMDNEQKIHTLVHADVTDPTSRLLSGMYLKSPVTVPEIGCTYQSYGDLTESGIIYCSQHGTMDDYRDALRRLSGISPKQERTDELMRQAMAGILVFLALCFGAYFKMRKSREKAVVE